MPGRLNGKVALITGSGGGQGRAAARLFAAEGALVAGCDLDPATAEETVRLVREAGGEMHSMHPLDLVADGSAQRWIEGAVDRWGGIDVLFNNAAAVRFAPFGELNWEDWAYTIRNELDIVYLTCHHAWPHLIRRRGGSIINTASNSGLKGSAGFGAAAHAAAKGGVLALTRHLAAEGGPHRIRVNSITPGAIESGPTARLLEDPAWRADAEARN